MKFSLRMKKFPTLYLFTFGFFLFAVFPVQLFSRQVAEPRDPVPIKLDGQGNHLIWTSGILELFDSEAGKVVWQKAWNEDSLPSTAFISEEKRWLVLSSAKFGETYIIDIQHKKSQPHFLQVDLIDMEFSPKSDRAFLLHSKTFWNSTLSEFHLPSWELANERKVSDYTLELAMSRDGNRLITSGRNKLIKSLDPGNLSTLRVNWESEILTKLIFHPSLSSIYAGITPENGIELRDLVLEKNISIIPPLVRPIVRLDFTAGGDYLISMDEDGRLLLWNWINSSNGYFIPNSKSENEALYDKHRKITFNEARQKIQTVEDIEERGGIPMENDHPLFLDYSTGKKYRIAPLPIIGYSAETRFFLGLTLDVVLRPKEADSAKIGYSRTSTIMPTVFYAFAGSWSAGVKSEFFHKNKWYLYNNVTNTKNNISVYYGVGGQPDRQNQNRFKNNVFLWQGMISRQLSNELFLGLKFESRRDSPLKLDFEGVSPIPDTKGSFVTGIGPVLRVDTRNNIFFPTTGQALEFSYQYFADLREKDTRFRNLIVDYRTYLPLSILTKGSVLAFQLHYQNVHGEHTPFYMLPYLGGDRLVRGAWRNLYIDKQSAMVQVELRSDFSKVDSRYGFVMFSGIGDVADNFFRNYSPAPVVVGGVGLRQQLIPKLKLQSRVDFTYSSRGDWGIFGGIGVSF